ncbi:MAG TPA: PIN domain-containing protein [Chitinophagaceae bacterium]|nr:PIN domain-containing protein [Chitinophagaceae bacterium]
MKIFLDANILVAVLNKEYPAFSYCARILALADSSRYRVYTSPLCLAIAFYFAEKKSGTFMALKKISIVTGKLLIAGMGATGVKQTIANKKINDFEDGLEYYSALHAGCKSMITFDTNDFYFSEIEVLTPEMFFEKYMMDK